MTCYLRADEMNAHFERLSQIVAQQAVHSAFTLARIRRNATPDGSVSDDWMLEHAPQARANVLERATAEDFTYHDYRSERRKAYRSVGYNFDAAHRRVAIAHIVAGLWLGFWARFWKLVALAALFEAARLAHIG